MGHDDDDELICRMDHQQKMLIFISSQSHCPKFSPLERSNTAEVGFEPK